MAIGVFELKVSKEVITGTEEFDFLTPVAGEKVRVISFEAEGAFSKNAYCALVWKHNHATEAEVILWSTKGSIKSFLSFKIPNAEIDGVRKLAVVCSNSEIGSLVLSAKAQIKVK